MADAVVIGLAKKVKPKKADAEEEASADEGEGEEMSLDGVEDDAVDELVGALGGGEDVDRKAVKAALHDFVRACMQQHQEGGEY